PLSFAQQRMWFINQFDTTAATYNIPAVLNLTGDLDADALRQAVIDVLERHEVLRTVFPARAGVPHQVVGDIADFDSHDVWRVVGTRDELLASVTDGFDVTTQWPLRVRLLSGGDRDFVLALTVHHIAADGESILPLVTDIVTAYTARAQGDSPDWAPLEVQFADFAIWQHTVLGSADDAESVIGRQLSYWRSQLAGAPDVLELPADRPRPAVASYAGADVIFGIPARVSDRVAAVAGEFGVTPFMVVHSALAVLLARLAATDDIAIGTPVAGRGQRVLDPLVGMFVNTLILRTRVDGSLSFAEFVDRTRTTDLDAVANADVPFETIVDAVGAVRSQAFSPLSQVWLSLNRSVLPELADADAAAGEIAGLKVSAVGTDELPAKVDLLVGVGQADDGPWYSSMVYATDLFDESTVRIFADQLLAILDAVLDNPDIAVGDIELGSGASVLTRPQPLVNAVAPVGRQIVDAEYVLTGGQGVDPLPLGDLFARAAQTWGPRQAVIDATGAALTHTQLDEQSNRLARWLIGRGIGAEDLVAVSM
nr:condensation domain-containing protein [Gordonia sp. (in: high G+C Gram-positive bacteria)]